MAAVLLRLERHAAAVAGFAPVLQEMLSFAAAAFLNRSVAVAAAYLLISPAVDDWVMLSAFASVELETKFVAGAVMSSVSAAAAVEQEKPTAGIRC